MNVRDLFDLAGRVAIVTGGGSGIGRQMADALAELGADVVLCARKVERCEQAAAEIVAANGTRALGLRCDISDKAEVEALVARTVAELGRIDIVVNNAGASWGAPAVDYPLEAWQKVIGVNLTGTFLVSQAAGRHMIERGEGGKIINVSSIAAFGGEEPEVMDAVGYSASKGGVISFTKDLAVKWARFGITVNALCPGWFPTEMSKVLVEKRSAALLGSTPLKRFGSDHDLKGAIALLASRASDYMTGSVVTVDGGKLAV
jgi:NAD(P)-dependent dehydrogenase (short-subunit alcohol dehydrogenase family)